MHFTRTHTTGTWTNGGAGGYVTLVSDWESLSDKVFAQINGDQGGTWAPSSRIVIDTSGMLISGPAKVAYNGSLTTRTNSRFVLGGGSNDWPLVGPDHVGRKLTRRSDMTARMSTPRLHWCASPDWPGSIQSIACTVNGASGLEQPKFALPLRVHNGARLVGATLTFRIPTARSIAPVQMPRMRIVRTDRDGNLVPLSSAVGGLGINDGWVSMPKPTTGDAWYAKGAAQTFEYVCDQANIVDTSAYLYWMEFVEEVGTAVVLPAGKSDGAVIRERKATVAWVFRTVMPLSGDPNPVPPEAGISGVPTLVDGDPVLIATSNPAIFPPSHNGIWIVNFAGVWLRRGDLAAAVDFGPGFLVPESRTWQVWECTTPSFGQSIVVAGPTGAPGTPIQFERRQPRGNIYHSLACHFDSIADMRPQ